MDGWAAALDQEHACQEQQQRQWHQQQARQVEQVQQQVQQVQEVQQQVLTLLQSRAFSILFRQNRLGGQDKITPVTATGRKWEQEQRWRSIFFANGGAAPEGVWACVSVGGCCRG